MQTKIQKWGNSLGLRIPKSFAEQVGVEAGSEVELSLEGIELVVRPLHRPRYYLKELLRTVTSRNVPRKWDSGAPVGREVW